MKCLRFGFLLAATVAAMGCGGRQPVAGEIRFADGTPLAVGQVVFESAELKCGGACEIGSDGRFEIVRPLPVGEYVVYVTDAVRVIDAGAGKFGPPLVNADYTRPETSPLRAQIGNGPVSLTVASP